MSKYNDRQFWVDAGDRAISTFAQSAVGALTAEATGLINVDWIGVGSIAGLAALVSVLTTVAFRGRDSQES